MFFGLFAPVVFLAPYAKHQGTGEYSAALLLSTFALVDMIIRPLTGFIGNSKWVRPRIQYLFSFAVSFTGVCHLLCPLSSWNEGLVVYAVFCGLEFGMLSALLFEALMDLVGARHFSSAVGLVTIIECGPVLLGSPISGLWRMCMKIWTLSNIVKNVLSVDQRNVHVLISGALVDIFGDYKYLYNTRGVFMLVPGIIMHYYNYKKMTEEPTQRVLVEIRMSDEALQLRMNQEDKTMKSKYDLDSVLWTSFYIFTFISTSTEMFFFCSLCYNY